MTRRYVSQPLLEMLRQADLTSDHVNSALDWQMARWTHASLPHSHPYMRRFRTGTGLNAVAISRKYRRLLVNIEQRGPDGGMLWHYREVGRTNCQFHCKGVIPAASLAALPGKSLNVLIQPHPALSAAEIRAAVATCDGWIELTLALSWTIF